MRDCREYIRWGGAMRVPASALMALLIFGVAGCSRGDRERVRDLDPRGTSLLGEAQQSYRRGDLARSLQYVDSAAAYVPELADVWFLKGLVLADLYRFDESDAAFEHALSLDPTYRSARFNMGHNAYHQSYYFAADRFYDALRYYRAEEALLRDALDGQSAGGEADRKALAAVLLQIGATYGNLNRPDSALLAYSEALKVDGTNARAFAWLAGAQQQAGSLDAALANALRAAEIEPQQAEYELLVGVLLNELGRHDEAIPRLTHAYRSQPWNRTAVYNLGQAFVGAGRPEEGEAYLASADTLEQLRAQIGQSHVHVFQDPSNPIRWENYAYLLQRAGRMAEAREAINVMRYLAQSDTAAR